MEKQEDRSLVTETWDIEHEMTRRDKMLTLSHRKRWSWDFRFRLLTLLSFVWPEDGTCWSLRFLLHPNITFDLTLNFSSKHGTQFNSKNGANKKQNVKTKHSKFPASRTNRKTSIFPRPESAHVCYVGTIRQNCVLLNLDSLVVSSVVHGMEERDGEEKDCDWLIWSVYLSDVSCEADMSSDEKEEPVPLRGILRSSGSTSSLRWIPIPPLLFPNPIRLFRPKVVTKSFQTLSPLLFDLDCATTFFFSFFFKLNLTFLECNWYE